MYNNLKYSKRLQTELAAVLCNGMSGGESITYFFIFYMYIFFFSKSALISCRL